MKTTRTYKRAHIPAMIRMLGEIRAIAKHRSTRNETTFLCFELDEKLHYDDKATAAKLMGLVREMLGMPKGHFSPTTLECWQADHGHTVGFPNKEGHTSNDISRLRVVWIDKIIADLESYQ